jgi:hypothetical protein
LRKFIGDNFISDDLNQVGWCLFEVYGVVQYSVDDNLYPMRIGGSRHFVKFCLATERPLYLREFYWLVAPPPLPYSLVALLWRRDVNVAVTKLSQSRNHFPDIIEAPIKQLNDNVPILDFWNVRCDPGNLCGHCGREEQAPKNEPASRRAFQPF